MGRTPLVVGIVLILVGLLWIFQGVGYVGGSFMTGQSQWVWIGIATTLAGVALLVWSRVR